MPHSYLYTRSLNFYFIHFDFRLFEMGFQEQLSQIFSRLPESRQTVLFSATLPKLLVEFARAGLHDPTLIRLDVDTKLSENLKVQFIVQTFVDFIQKHPNPCSSRISRDNLINFFFKSLMLFGHPRFLSFHAT